MLWGGLYDIVANVLDCDIIEGGGEKRWIHAFLKGILKHSDYFPRSTLMLNIIFNPLILLYIYIYIYI